MKRISSHPNASTHLSVHNLGDVSSLCFPRVDTQTPLGPLNKPVICITSNIHSGKCNNTVCEGLLIKSLQVH